METNSTTATWEYPAATAIHITIDHGRNGIVQYYESQTNEYATLYVGSPVRTLHISAFTLVATFTAAALLLIFAVVGFMRRRA
jgi:hypothetical protein